MSDTAVKARIEELTNSLITYNTYYYNYNQSLIPDSAYDRMLRELKDLEVQYPHYQLSFSPTKTVGTKPLKGVTMRHDTPMLSLDNIFSLPMEDNSVNQDELEAWWEKTQKAMETALPFKPDGALNKTIVAEYKYDGLALSLTYDREGKLIKALTRGDGETGEYVLPNVQYIDSIPKEIDLKHPDGIEIRGEVLMYFEDFDKANTIRALKDEQAFANPRNAASGIMRQSNPEVLKDYRLTFIPYTLVTPEITKNQIETLLLFEKLGFTVTDYGQFNTLEGIKEFYLTTDKNQHRIPFPIDGIVLKVNDNDIAYGLDIDRPSRYPNSAIAYKLPPETALSTVEAIDIQVGRTGNLTPVARITPTYVGGTTIRNITLHNESEITRKGIRVGCCVVIQRAGDVIPEITEVIKDDKHYPNLAEYRIPDTCPSCHERVVKVGNGVITQCPNHAGCLEQRIRALQHASERDCLDVEGIGPELIRGLLETRYGRVNAIPSSTGLNTDSKGSVEAYGAVNSIPTLSVGAAEAVSDYIPIAYLFNLNENILSEYFKETKDMDADKLIKNILASLEKAKKPELYRFIFALGIPNVGKGVAKDLVKAFGTLEAISKATKEEIEKIDGFGKTIATSVYQYFQSDLGKREVLLLLDSGVLPIEKPIDTKDTLLKDEVFCITGSFNDFKREEIISLLESKGAKVSGSVSKKTTYLIAGENAGSKLTKAKDFGVPILDESAFKRFLLDNGILKTIVV